MSSNKKKELNLQSHLFKKYLPQSSFSLAQSAVSQQSSVLCTHENYMLILGYTSSLEKQIETLKEQLTNQIELNKGLILKNSQLEQTNKKNHVNGHIFLNQSVRNTHYKAQNQVATTFGGIKNKSFQNQKGGENKNLLKNDSIILSESLEKQLIIMLKEQNERLRSKIDELFKDKEKMITCFQQSAIKFTKNPLQQNKQNKAGKQNDPFDNININNILKEINDTESARQEESEGLKRGFIYPKQPAYDVNRVTLSEPNSFEVSFQALPTFKSCQSMPPFPFLI